MIEHRTGDIFAQPDVNVIVHQANLYHTFGAGIAKVIRERYPKAYDRDCQTAKGDPDKLGTFSAGRMDDGKIIVNMYSQTGIGGQDRNTSYDAMTKALTELEKTLQAHQKKVNAPVVLGIPYTIGCGLAGGNWLIVSAIIKSVFENSSIKVVICRIPSQPEVESCFDIMLKDTGFVDPHPDTNDEVF